MLLRARTTCTSEPSVAPQIKRICVAPILSSSSTCTFVVEPALVASVIALEPIVRRGGKRSRRRDEKGRWDVGMEEADESAAKLLEALAQLDLGAPMTLCVAHDEADAGRDARR